MERYRQEREKQEKIGTVTGIVAAVGIHVLLAVFGVFTGLKYIYPPPPETTFLIDFSDTEIERPKQIRNGSRPQAEEIDRSKPIELVQRSKSPIEGTKENKAPEAKVDDFGDVDIKQPEREKEIDRRSLFPAADNKTDKDTLAAQTASRVSDALKAGHASGNTASGKTSGKPNAHLKGRTVLGSLPKPTYSVQEEGVVVVQIWVDQYGKVQKAVPGYSGTTVDDKTLWAAARSAAMNAHFNISADAPAMQQGTITYYFKLK